MSNIDLSKKIYFIVGPTASGKTGLSIKLAKEIEAETGQKCEIISADSRQIYIDLNLSSGKVTTEEMDNIAHFGLDLINPGENYSVALFEAYALKKIEEIQLRENIPIIVGGTGFYIDTILYKNNLHNVSENKSLREELDEKSCEEVFKILEQELEQSRIPGILQQFSSESLRKNKRKLIRAIELITELGYYPVLEKSLRFSNFEIIYIKPEKEKQMQNINIRFEARIKNGMIEEIENVIKKYNLNEEKLKSLGFEFHLTWQFLNNQINFERYKELFLIQELQYTKRQKTWFNRYEKLPQTKIIS